MIQSLRLFALTAILILAQSVAVQASDPYTQAYLKWDAGNYIEALEEFLEILDGPDADLYFDDIAKLTGEIYKVDQLSIDGDNPVFSPDNRHFSWEEEADGETKIHISRVYNGEVENLHTTTGHSMIFSPDGRQGVIKRTNSTPKTEALQAELDEALDARDRSAIMYARNELQVEELNNTSLYKVDLETGETSELQTENLLIRTPVFTADGSLLFTGAAPDNHTRSDIYSMPLDGSSPERVTQEPGFYDAPMPVSDQSKIVFRTYSSSPFPTPADEERREYEIDDAIVLYDINQGELNRWAGQSPVISADGSRLAFINPNGNESSIYSASLADSDFEEVEMVSSADAIQHPALSPDGNTLAYMLREGISWDIHLVYTETGTHDRLSYDIQHELFPHFINNREVVGMMGEARHRRSHIYDLETKDFYRLFHNNEVRTVSMENDWEFSANGEKMLVTAERDGNTISPEQGVYVVHIGEKISKEALADRLKKNLESERNLRANAEKMYEPIHDAVQKATDEVNITRLYHYQKALYDFGSKHMTQPGNEKAMDYIYEQLKSFGYEPELQWFSPSDDIETANVIARLEGTEHPEVVYILSSHFDSVQRSPGADDNSSGTAVLLETARVLADNPQPATIIFASLTAEESGLLGAREFVRVADEEGLEAAGVVNNDMMGWTRHHRLDNTIRFSNYGIRDVQHSGAILFSDLITYDSRYYRFTDAHVFFDAYGDVIGGIGSYPILGNPNYHQTTDRLETINHQLVKEVTKSTTATLSMLANAPSKVTGIRVDERRNNRAAVQWNAAKENDISHYRIKYTDSSGEKTVEETDQVEITLRNVDASKPISVVAVNNRGMQAWDWTVAE